MDRQEGSAQGFVQGMDRTTFESSHAHSRGVIHDGSIGSRLSDVDEAAEPPLKDQEEDQGKGVEPKPGHAERVWVRRSCGEVAEIDVVNRIEERHEERDDDWELLAVDGHVDEEERP